MRKKKTIFQKNKEEIFYHIINSALAGALVFIGSLTNGLTLEGFFAGMIASLVVAISKFKSYWSTQEKEYKRNLKSLSFFNFI